MLIFPVHAFLLTARWSIDEPSVSRFRQIDSPPVEGYIPGDFTHLVKGVHPFRQVVVILTVLVPFQLLVKRLTRLPFR